MDTLIYIILAVVILLFQGYTQKKQKERKRNMAQGERSATPQREEELSVSDFLKKMLKEERIHNTYYDEDPYLSILNENIEAVPEAEDYFDNRPPEAYNEERFNTTEEGRRSTLDTESIKIPEPEPLLTISPFGEKFDPKLFILYSELAKPKYLE